MISQIASKKLVIYRYYNIFLRVSEVSLILVPGLGYHVSDKSTGGLPVNTAQAIANRIRQLCKQHGLTPNGLSTLAAVPQSTVKSILGGESQNPGTVTIKKLCDALEITLGEFFSTPDFDALEQEIK